MAWRRFNPWDSVVLAWVAAVLIVLGVVSVVWLKVLPDCWREHPTWSVWQCVDEALRTGGPFAPPSRPAPKAVVPAPPPQLTLSWTDNSSGQAGVRVDRKTGTDGAFALLVELPAGATSYVDATVASGTTYCYRVRAYNAAGESGDSNESCGAVAAALEVTVETRGTGRGTVRRNPTGATGAAGNSATYPIGTVVTLEAAADAGSVFAGWSGGGCSGREPCGVAGNGTITVTATFEPASAERPTLLQPSGMAAVAPGNVVTFAWTSVPGAAQYGFEFSGTNRQFANPNGTAPDSANGFGGAGGGFLVSGTALTLTLPTSIPAGTYQVRVIGVTGQGLVGTFSDAVTIVVGAGSARALR